MWYSPHREYPFPFGVHQQSYISPIQRRRLWMSHQEKRQHIAVYPGSFDPLTNGHLDIARRAARLFDYLIIAVYAHPAKNLLFSADERVALWQEVIASEGLTNVRVDQYTHLTVNYVRSVGGSIIIKG